MGQVAIVQAIAAYSTSVISAGLPPEIIEKAKLCLIDCLAACLAIDRSVEAIQTIEALTGRGEAAAASVFGRDLRTSPELAAFINSISASSTSRTDTHTATASHPGMVIIPAVLALAESIGAPQPRILESIVVGYEVMCRLGAALITAELARTFRPTGLIGPAGAAMACAHLLGLDEPATANAVALACNAAGGLNAWAHAGTNEHVFHSAQAARNGIMAAWLAQCGVVASQLTIEGPAGLLDAFGVHQRKASLTAGLGREYAMLSIVHKPAPTCIFAQGPSQVAAKLAARTGIDPSMIESIEVRVTNAAAEYPGCDFRGPITTKPAGQMSIQFSVASILMTGGIHDANWDRYNDSEVNRLAAMSTVIVDATLDEAYPSKNGTKLDVRLRDGSVLHEAQDNFRSMTSDEVIGRFLLNGEAVMGNARTCDVLNLIQEFDRHGDVIALAKLLRGRM
jgi:2-methylcitrate dehydratase PrpD